MKTINRKIHLKAFGYNSGQILFQLTFEPWYPEEKYYSIVTSLCGNRKISSIFGEEIGNITIEEEGRVKEMGCFGGLTVEVMDTGSGTLVEMPSGNIVPFRKAMNA